MKILFHDVMQQVPNAPSPLKTPSLSDVCVFGDRPLVIAFPHAVTVDCVGMGNYEPPGGGAGILRIGKAGRPGTPPSCATARTACTRGRKPDNRGRRGHRDNRARRQRDRKTGVWRRCERPHVRGQGTRHKLHGQEPAPAATFTARCRWTARTPCARKRYRNWRRDYPR